MIKSNVENYDALTISIPSTISIYSEKYDSIHN